MYFPWVGMLEQIRLSDIFIFYGDVQFSRGFYNRVQIKTKSGWNWLTIPLTNRSQKSKIDELVVSNESDWQSQHLNSINDAYRAAPFKHDALKLVESVFSHGDSLLSELSKRSTMALAEYYSLHHDTEFKDSKNIFDEFSGSERLLKLCKLYDSNVYITGHGALKYISHDLFDSSGVDIKYMNYQKRQYNQQHGTFNPYVSGLDLVANCGPGGLSYICSKAVYWKDFCNNRSSK